MFVVTHVRQALQQTAAIGAFSPYLALACAIRPVQIVFTLGAYATGEMFWFTLNKFSGS
jgi:hypothetical protein